MKDAISVLPCCGIIILPILALPNAGISVQHICPTRVHPVDYAVLQLACLPLQLACPSSSVTYTMYWLCHHTQHESGRDQYDNMCRYLKQDTSIRLRKHDTKKDKQAY